METAGTSIWEIIGTIAFVIVALTFLANVVMSALLHRSIHKAHGGGI